MKRIVIVTRFSLYTRRGRHDRRRRIVRIGEYFRGNVTGLTVRGQLLIVVVVLVVGHLVGVLRLVLLQVHVVVLVVPGFVSHVHRVGDVRHVVRVVGVDVGVVPVVVVVGVVALVPVVLVVDVAVGVRTVRLVIVILLLVGVVGVRLSPPTRHSGHPVHRGLVAPHVRLALVDCGVVRVVHVPGGVQVLGHLVVLLLGPVAVVLLVHLVLIGKVHRSSTGERRDRVCDVLYCHSSRGYRCGGRRRRSLQVGVHHVGRHAQRARVEIVALGGHLHGDRLGGKDALFARDWRDFARSDFSVAGVGGVPAVLHFDGDRILFGYSG